MTHYVLVLHSNRDDDLLYVMADAIEYYEGGEIGTWIYLHGAHALYVAESPEEISRMISWINTGNISLTDTRSEQERGLNGERH